MSKEGLCVGVGISLSSLISVLEEHSKQEGYAYYREQLVPMLLKVASTPIRNVSIGGDIHSANITCSSK